MTKHELPLISFRNLVFLFLVFLFLLLNTTVLVNMLA